MAKHQIEPSEISNTPHADEVQRQLIEELQKNGITHVLNWMDEWYLKEAQAFWLDQVAQAQQGYSEGRWTNTRAQQETKHLLTALLVKEALLTCDPASQSTQAGSTHQRRARVSAAAHLYRALPQDIQEMSVTAIRVRREELFNKHYSLEA